MVTLIDHTAKKLNNLRELSIIFIHIDEDHSELLSASRDSKMINQSINTFNA